MSTNNHAHKLKIYDGKTYIWSSSYVTIYSVADISTVAEGKRKKLIALSEVNFQ